MEKNDVGFFAVANATRWCTEAGNWYINNATNRTWSNYSACINTEPEPTPLSIIVHTIFMVKIQLFYITT